MRADPAFGVSMRMPTARRLEETQVMGWDRGMFLPVGFGFGSF